MRNLWKLWAVRTQSSLVKEPHLTNEESRQREVSALPGAGGKAENHTQAICLVEPTCNSMSACFETCFLGIGDELHIHLQPPAHPQQQTWMCKREGHFARSEGEIFYDQQPPLVVADAALLRAVCQPSGFRNDLIWMGVMLSSNHTTRVATMPSGACSILLETPRGWSSSMTHPGNQRQRTGLEVQPEFWSPGSYFSRPWANPLWPSHFTLLSFNFPICKMRRLG